ncbi:hypothetical protein NM688_g4504 [Phlebia brevispora]|uniref:Uncharacterized protein n=1 Tax=Phlebia brevispora TaxID=194682 RepID=A0ACC1T2G0_9APHY|nr:hypothetical protein NM688_g4504 [Phlebia brevispora]
MSDEQTFTIAVPQSALDSLAQKLAQATLPSAAPESENEWDYGVPLKDVERLVARWKDGFDWKAAEAELNASLPQYTRPIEVEGHGTFTAHYVHKKSEKANAIPLLFLHGWPGHFGEVRKILPLLANPTEVEAPAFHVVAPSLPGFGFSSAPTKKGFSGAQYAEFSNKLMLSLGYEEYVVQGGDWGFYIARTLAKLYPKQVKAWHTNFPAGRPPELRRNPILYLQHMVTPYTQRDRKGLERSNWFASVGRGYYELQSTKPQTLGYSLADSPVGLLAWVYEKLVTWTDEYPWTDDEVLTWVSLYLFSAAGPAASVRIYFETKSNAPFADFAKSWSSVPLGLSFFPRELRITPKTWARTIGNVVFESEHTKGGHFAAFEVPEALVGDLRKMFGKGGKGYNAVKGKDGY